MVNLILIKQTMLHQQSDFILKGNVDFNDRQKSIFGALDSLTPENTKQRYSPDEFQNAQSKITVSSVKKELKQFRGQESIFKMPDIPRKRSFKMPIPDFVKNPQKWKRYKMGSDVMTDKGNTAAAMAFLKEMEERQEPMEVDSFKGPIIFNKHVLKDDGEKLAEEDEGKSSFVSTKTVMPEYVVGQKVKKKVTFKKTIQAETPSQTIKLQHLYDIDE